ncbi:hypothetical protein BDV93DRAFT_530029 [Ceratobasidium sp. AG-I]|nr:hypothetical protein BDV93DRAFT_530030 [Ceratobasidium sp. AG-I]KAF8593039.1 hypothetical protein BDV93DRAFT_530029 [Ceratobasidium sp. AG-I]
MFERLAQTCTLHATQMSPTPRLPYVPSESAWDTSGSHGCLYKALAATRCMLSEQERSARGVESLFPTRGGLGGAQREMVDGGNKRGPFQITCKRVTAREEH